MYDDVGLKEAIDKGVIPGPHILCATRAISAPDPVNSSGSQPLPIPRSSRPPERTSTVAACLAVSSGEANGWLTTATPSLMAEVAEAR